MTYNQALICLFAKFLSSDLAAAKTLLFMLEGMFGLWIGVLEFMKGTSVLSNVRYLYYFLLFLLCLCKCLIYVDFWGLLIYIHMYVYMKNSLVVALLCLCVENL